MVDVQIEAEEDISLFFLKLCTYSEESLLLVEGCVRGGLGLVIIDESLGLISRSIRMDDGAGTIFLGRLLGSPVKKAS